MSKFRFKVWSDKYAVTMQVLEQPEETRGKGLLFEHGGIKIRSGFSPTIGGRTIFIRGTSLDDDNRAMTTTFCSLSEAELYRRKITEALSAYAKHLELNM